MRFRSLYISAILMAAACATTPSAPPAPWDAAPLAAVPEVYRKAWENAGNRSSCALVAFANPPTNATPRRATFAGGWAVAYDTPSQRSAFGVAGTGVRATGDSSTYQWPDEIVWTDGSRASYGLEGGTGPNHLAYLTIDGQDCLYNVWSAGGRDHLFNLLHQIRFVTDRSGKSS